MHDEYLEHQIEFEYRRLCAAKTKTAKTKAWNRMLALQSERSKGKIEAMERERMARAKNNG